MINIQAKNRLLSLYQEGDSSYEKVSIVEYKQLYYAVRAYIISGNQEWINAVGRFLVHGTCAYDRFMGLRPQFVDEELYDMFCRFLDTLQSLDGKSYNRTYIFHLDKVLWEIYRDCSLVPYNKELNTFLSNYENRIESLVAPKGNAKVEENLKTRKAVVLGLINGIRKGDIRSKIHTTLPFCFTDTDATVTLKMNGISIFVHMINHSQGSTLPGTRIAEGSTLITSGPSKWTTTTCELDIVADCMLDGLELRPSVTLQKVEDKRYWTAVFDFTYHIISILWMQFQKNGGIKGSWPPLPNDIHYVDYKVEVCDEIYDQEYTTNPALVYSFQPLKKATRNFEFNEEFPDWSEYAYHFAKVYAESGQLKESIFWLNVSVEALIEEFIRKIATTPDILAEIEGVEHKYDTAEQILIEQFPEMKGKVKWPETIIHTSVFTKLKRAIKFCAKESLQKVILKKYSQVNAKRNALFHGVSVDVSIEDVEKSFIAYTWLSEHLL